MLDWKRVFPQEKVCFCFLTSIYFCFYYSTVWIFIRVTNILFVMNFRNAWMTAMFHLIAACFTGQWYQPHFTPGISNTNVLSRPLVSHTDAEGSVSRWDALSFKQTHNINQSWQYEKIWSTLRSIVTRGLEVGVEWSVTRTGSSPKRPGSSITCSNLYLNLTKLPWH